MKPRSAAARYLPLCYLLLSLALVAVLLPTALRPPPDAPPSSAQLSPDAPPDEEVILTDLKGGTSTTAGATVGVVPGDGPGTIPGGIITTKPRKGRCFGRPERQLESVYSVPCAPAWTGNNGGATWRGVTKDDIRMCFLMSLTGNADRDEEITDNPANDRDDDQARTYRVLKAYFNQNLELYDRKLRFFYVQSKRDDPNDPTVNRAAARRAIENYQCFAAINETSVATFDELSRGGIVTFTLGQVNREFLAKRRPYAWSATPDSTGLIDLGAEYLCQKLAGKPPKWNEQMDPTFDYAKPRVFGMLAYQEGAGYQESVPLMRKQLKDRCGVEIKEAIEYGLGTTAGSRDSAQAIPAAISRLRAAGVTTVISMQDFVDNIYFTQEAANQRYYPEWYLNGFGGMDVVQEIFQSYEPTEWKHAFGFSVYEVPTPSSDHECNRAYHSIDPDRGPDSGMCYYMWAQMVQLFGAMQLAGPKLTPDTIQSALYAYGHHAPNPVWRMAGGYSPADWTYPDYGAEIWYDPVATHPINGRPAGAYHYINGGKRITRGEVTSEEPAFFKDQGMLSAPRQQ